MGIKEDDYQANPFDYSHGACTDTTTFAKLATIAAEIPTRYGQRGKGGIESQCTDGKHTLVTTVVDGQVVKEEILVGPNGFTLPPRH